MLRLLKNYFVRHPKEVCMSYFEHYKFSMGLSYFFLKKSYKSFIHAHFQNIYITSASDSIKDIQKKLKDKGCR